MLHGSTFLVSPHSRSTRNIFSSAKDSRNGCCSCQINPSRNVRSIKISERSEIGSRMYCMIRLRFNPILRENLKNYEVSRPRALMQRLAEIKVRQNQKSR